jgi:hypothetical protein
VPVRPLVVRGSRALLSGLVAGVVTALLTLAGAAAAHADQVVLRDPAGDVTRTTFGGGSQPAPRTRVGDVRRAAVRHGRHAVVVRVRYRELRRVGAYWLFEVRLRTGAHRYREVRVEATRHHWRGVERTFDQHGRRVACRVRHRIDYRRDVVRIQVPRACLGTPRRVRATVAGYRADRSRARFYVDDPHDRTAATRGATRWLRAG